MVQKDAARCADSGNISPISVRPLLTKLQRFWLLTLGNYSVRLIASIIGPVQVFPLDFNGRPCTQPIFLATFSHIIFSIFWTYISSVKTISFACFDCLVIFLYFHLISYLFWGIFAPKLGYVGVYGWTPLWGATLCKDNVASSVCSGLAVATC